MEVFTDIREFASSRRGLQFLIPPQVSKVTINQLGARSDKGTVVELEHDLEQNFCGKGTHRERLRERTLLRV